MRIKFLTLLVTMLLLAGCGEIIVTPTDEDAFPPAAVPTKTAAILPTQVPSGEGQTETVLLSDCTVVSSLPEPRTEFVQLFSVNEHDWVLGPEDAAITLIEYGDFQ